MRRLPHVSRPTLRVSPAPVEIRTPVEIIPAYTTGRLSRGPFDGVEIRSIEKASATIRSSFVVRRVAIAWPIATSYGSYTSFLSKNAILGRQIPAAAVAASVAEIAWPQKGPKGMGIVLQLGTMSASLEGEETAAAFGPRLYARLPSAPMRRPTPSSLLRPRPGSLSGPRRPPPTSVAVGVHLVIDGR